MDDQRLSWTNNANMDWLELTGHRWKSTMSDVLYMENITLLPTRLDVIMETMKIWQRVTSECDEVYMVVHYDLAIAKPALQIQAT